MSDLTDRTLHLAIEAAHAAVTDPARWADCLTATAHAAQAAGAALFRPGASPSGGALVVHGTMAHNHRAYFDHWVQRDPWNAALAAARPFDAAGDLRLSQELISPQAYRQTDYFDGHGRHHDSGHKLFLKVCDAADPISPPVHLTLNRPLAHEPFGEGEAAVIARLWPHLRQAVQAFALLRQVQTTQRLAESALDQLPMPAWIVRADHRIEFANGAALLAGRDCRWIKIEGGRLVRFGALAEELLRDALSRCAQGVGHAREFAYPRAPDQIGRGTVRLVPIQESPLYAVTWPHASALILLDTPDPEVDRDYITGHLGPHFSLTPAECRVLSLLASGLEPKEIAKALSISPATASVHLRALREKTGRRTQVGLVRLVLGR